MVLFQEIDGAPSILELRSINMAKIGKKLEGRTRQTIDMTLAQKVILRKLGMGNMAIGLDHVFRLAGVYLERRRTTKNGRPGKLIVQRWDGTLVNPESPKASSYSTEQQ